MFVSHMIGILFFKASKATLIALNENIVFFAKSKSPVVCINFLQ